MTAQNTARLQLVAAALLFSTGGAAIKYTSFDAWQVAGLRSAVAACAVLIAVPAARRGWNLRTLVVSAAYAATMVSFVVANKLTTSANAIFLQSTAPLYIVLASPWLLRERIRGRDWVVLLAIALGLSLFFVGTSEPIASAPDPWRGNLVALASGLLWASTVLGLRWLATRTTVAYGPGKSEVAATVALGNILAAAACLPWALPVSGSTQDWITILYLGVFQIGLAYVLLTAGLGRVPALEASLLLLVEPVFNPVWAWLVQGERVTLWALLGGAIIIGATSTKAWLDSRPALGPLAEPPSYP